MAGLDHLAIVRVETLDGVSQAASQLLFQHGRGGRELAMVAQLLGQIHRRPVRVHRFGDRAFAIDGAPCCLMVPTMRVDESVAGDLPQPKMKRHHRIAKVFAHSAIRLDQRLLNDVAGIDAALHGTVHPQRDESTHGRAMTFE